jgi:hypothetical protein
MQDGHAVGGGISAKAKDGQLRSVRVGFKAEQLGSA